tara:strand:- start:4812 stop:5000 length:189 start_codon:yes stop_codon:yes gene_type:complete
MASELRQHSGRGPAAHALNPPDTNLEKPIDPVSVKLPTIALVRITSPPQAQRPHNAIRRTHE